MDEVLVRMGEYVAPVEGKWLGKPEVGSAFT
ncbi:MAG: Unknown protein [uncultured Sulfurovum sp.]|uniref:Uncharacterized protein n=1 Tax=uncultured Sulfurovum sp. TaxID=269237 RepID=A0A6S6TBP4_9BACT|nr:MAG: Unknown protein [uncultured Sulfurovum sp.]